MQKSLNAKTICFIDFWRRSVKNSVFSWSFWDFLFFNALKSQLNHLIRPHNTKIRVCCNFWNLWKFGAFCDFHELHAKLWDTIIFLQCFSWHLGILRQVPYRYRFCLWEQVVKNCWSCTNQYIWVVILQGRWSICSNP